MKLHGAITINNQKYSKGTDLPWFKIYPFFMFHMLMFGGSGFLIAYASGHPPLLFLYLHGGIAITVYTLFYLAIFGLDEVKWMFINSFLGLLGIYSQIGWILALFGRRIDDYPVSVHVIPFLYFILYTFLIRHALLEITGARENDRRKRQVEYAYIGVSMGGYLTSYFLT
jgi:hypothetical protein